jgi:acetoin utilization deacetylase AcuC-like enzyme
LEIEEIVSTAVPGIPRMAVLEDPRFREHAGPDGHPERPERLAAVGAAIAARREPLARIAPRRADDEEILRVHAPAHLAHLRASVGRAPLRLDPDTYLGPRSVEVAELAAGGLVDLCGAVARREVETGLAAVRPPGHHAEADRAMGFCLLNNVAIAARALQAREGVERVLILDWDVHHGNGTQHSFEADPSVLYFSTHQFPYYPGTGDFGEAGLGKALGTTVNVPMPAGCGDAEYVGAMQRVLAPVARWYRPDVVLVSCGFDAHRDDPLAAMDVTGTGFLAMAAIVRELAEELCGGRLVFALEGGYSPTGLAEGTAAVLEAVLRPQRPQFGTVDLPAGSMLRRIVDSAVEVHGRRIPGLGAA